MNLTLKNIPELVNFLKEEEYLITKVVIDAVLDSMSTKKSKVKCISVYIEEDDEEIEIIAFKKEFDLVLTTNLKLLEKYEDYERCSKVKQALNQLKSL